MKKRIIKAKSEELASRTALTSNFGESLMGMVSIRVFGRESVFQKKYEETLENHSKANCSYWGEMRVYTVWLELLGILFCAGYLFGMIRGGEGVQGKSMCEGGGEGNEVGEVGQMIIILLQITEILQYGFNLLISIELLMSCVDRLFSFRLLGSLTCASLPPSISSCFLPPSSLSPPSSSVSFLPSPFSSFPPSPSSLPHPLIEFHEVSFSYPNFPPILDHISFSLYPFEKLAFIGQSGCGKTSLLNLIFGLVKPISGKIYLNDQSNVPPNVPLKDSLTVPLKFQTFLTIVPQETTVFSGTVRRNLDPKGEFSDEKLNDVLQMVQLGDKQVERGENKERARLIGMPKFFCLDIEAEQLSRGQRQLLWLARVLLDKAEVVVMDEATGGLDGDTEASVFGKVIENIRYEPTEKKILKNYLKF